ncbi:MAG TPA: efflux RND transporter permease subunit [Candidatus Acidoferrales bacterium]|nr:efflux RND transporter permease subunit [Candidatus Acidoferrales bacterium]
MNISAPFVKRPVATSLLSMGLLLFGGVAYRSLPMARLPEVEYPTITVFSSLPGASPETVATAIATPLERMFGRIAGITQMTSVSQLGGTYITMLFDLSRDVNGAARDVQAAINAARGQLPANLPTNPNWRKVNPAESDFMNLAVTSDTATRPELYDVAESIVAQKLLQIPGMGQVNIGGGSRPGVRVELNPLLLSKLGIGLNDVRAALAAANADVPKGALSDNNRMMILNSNDQLFRAKQYAPLIIAYRNGAPVRLSDVATIVDSQENIRNAGFVDGKPAIILDLFRQPQANIIDTSDRVMALLPMLRASIPPSMHLEVTEDSTRMIRASVRDVQVTLIISVVLVILVVFCFLRSVWATSIPTVVVPLSLVGTFGVMYLLHYSIDNLSLMALTISTGFVVDDAIVVIENISRYLEQGLPPLEAALRGSREISFTVLSMSTSLIAVFIPILLMGGILGRIFREFAVTLSVAVAISMIVSLTTTPAMCAKFLKSRKDQKHGRLGRAGERGFNWMYEGYAKSLRWVLGHQPFVLGITVGTVCLATYLYVVIPKGFFPQQDTGRINGIARAREDTSFQTMQQKLLDYLAIVKADPAVEAVTGFISRTNVAGVSISLKPLGQRKDSATQIINRLRPKLATVPGANFFMQPQQDVQIGGRGGNAQFQYTLQGDNLQDLLAFAPIVDRKLRTIPELQDVNSDLQSRALKAGLVIDRDTAARLGLSAQTIDNALYDAFGQRQVSTMYKGLNQYHVVMEIAQEFQQSPDSLKNIYVRSNTGREIPLSAFTHYDYSTTSLAVAHQGQFPAITFSFNLAPNVTLGEAVVAVQDAVRTMIVPATIHPGFQGTAQVFQDSLASEPYLILAALVTIYIVLGILYENYVHPVTILSTLPSAGVGALLALLIFRTELSIIAFIGIILLIGIVKKNAILMIDFAIQAEREEGNSPEQSIYQACLLRFRPIIMTTMAAMFAGVPIAVGGGNGSELRRPLGIAIVGGLLVSQMLTLYTTPVVYLYMDRFRAWASGAKTLRALQDREGQGRPQTESLGAERAIPSQRAANP